MIPDTHKPTPQSENRDRHKVWGRELPAKIPLSSEVYLKMRGREQKQREDGISSLALRRKLQGILSLFFTLLMFVTKKKKIKPGSSGAHLLSQHSGGRGRQISEFEASLVYRVSSRTARAIQRNPVSKNQTKPTKQTKKPKNKERERDKL